MIGTFIEKWNFMWQDVWLPLYENTLEYFSEIEEEFPIDIYDELYRNSFNYLKENGNYLDIEESADFTSLDIDFNQAELAQLKAKHFASEVHVIQFLKLAYEIIEEYDYPLISSTYFDLIQIFISKFGLRYTLQEPFELKLDIPFLIVDLFREVKYYNERDDHLLELFDDLETSFDNFVDDQSRNNLSTLLAKSSNYIEGLASQLSGINGQSLSQLLNQLNCWPHERIKESLEKIYGFFSDYPGIRHGGDPNNKIRELDTKDSLLITAMIFIFSGYIHDGITGEFLLGKFPNVRDSLEKISQDQQQRYQNIKKMIIKMGQSNGNEENNGEEELVISRVKEVEHDHYFAFRESRNFVCVEFNPLSNDILLYLNIDPEDVELEPGFSRDVSDVIHPSIGDLELKIKGDRDIGKAKPLILLSYQQSLL